MFGYELYTNVPPADFLHDFLLLPEAGAHLDSFHRLDAPI